MANTNAETKIEGTVSNHCYTIMKSRTKSRTYNLNFSWTIDKYSVCRSTDSVTLKSAAFSAVDDDDTKWYLTHYTKPCGRNPDMNLYLDNDVLGTRVLVSGNAKLYVMKSGGKMAELLGEELSFKFDFNDSKKTDARYVGCGEFSYVKKTVEALREDKLTIHCQVTYTKQSDIGTTYSTSLVSTPIKIPESNHSLDFEKILNDEYFSDVTISVEGKNYPGHKAILSARSPVFNTMFRIDMQESQRNHIVITHVSKPSHIRAPPSEKYGKYRSSLNATTLEHFYHLSDVRCCVLLYQYTN